MPPTVLANGKPLYYGQSRVGQYATELDTGNIVICMWKPLFRIKESYAMSCGLFDQIDDEVKHLYVIDSDSGDVFKFKTETYLDAPIFHMHGQRQFVPKAGENVGYWEQAEEDIIVKESPPQEPPSEEESG